MKKRILLITTVLFLFWEAKAQSFEIEIWQKGKKIEGTNNVLKLKKEPFQLKVKLENLKGVYVMGSYSENLSAYIQNAMNDTQGDISPLAHASSEYNPKQSLIISNKGFLYLFFNPQIDWHRFDRNGVEVIENTVIGTRTVRMIEDFIYNEDILIEDFSQNLYLIFMTTEATQPKKETLLLTWKE